MATKLARTGTSSTNATKFTWSAWVKRANIGSGSMMIYNYLNGDNRAYLQFQSDDKIYYYDKDGGDIQASLTTAAVYRDPNAFYHICLIGDSTDGTQGDRIQLYINGVRQSMSGTYPDASDSLGMKVHTGTNYHVLGTNSESTSNPFLGVMSHVHYVDGIDYPATTFGSTDATTGEWKINTSPSITTANYGNNGYFILKDTNSGTDQSGNSHNLTVTSGTLTKTEDCPSNVFATMNPLIPGQTGYVYSNGNNTVAQTGGTTYWVKSNSTLGMSSGKYYWEAKYVSGLYTVVGVDKTDTATPYPSTSSSAVGWKRNGNVEVATTPQTDIASYAHGDIVSVALDMDNACVYFGKGGVWQNSGDPTSGASKTGAYSLPSYVANIPYFATVSPYDSSGGATSMNFGNGYFGTTAVSSAGTNASGIGIFEYDVPTGYTALSTKGLNL